MILLSYASAAVAALVNVARAATDTDPTLWYVTRAAAICAYMLLALTAIMGLARATLRSAGGNAGAIWLLDELHPFASVLAAAFVAAHLLSLVFDPLIPFSLGNLLLPGNEPYAPFATSLGVLGLYALAIVLLSSWLRRALPYTFWRRLHALSFVVFTLITVHGILAGSDSGTAWMRAIYFASAGIVLFLVVARLLVRPQPVPATA